MTNIFRLELKDEKRTENVNAGVYRSDNYGAAIGIDASGFLTSTTEEAIKVCPMPRDDDLLAIPWGCLEEDSRPPYVFAFESMVALCRWFSNISGLTDEHKDAIRIAEYSVNEEHWIQGSTQCVALQEHMTLVNITLIDNNYEKLL